MLVKAGAEMTGPIPTEVGLLTGLSWLGLNDMSTGHIELAALAAMVHDL
jgi:hypothetical protein